MGSVMVFFAIADLSVGAQTAPKAPICLSVSGVSSRGRTMLE